MPNELTREKIVPAAQYLRMSTEHQRYSLENQRVAIAAYAALRGYTVIETFIDPGKSGLSLAGRKGLKRLLSEVLQGRPQFREILVLDVSRWGRFQDVDQSAHYEFICRQAGIPVRYCAEPFENDGSPMSSIMKHMKRVMAAEYSRELSAKVSRAQRLQASLGFKQGGFAPLGLRRMLIDEEGRPRGLLKLGQHKRVNTDRTVLVPGPPSEIALVKRIFELYVDEKLSFQAIARRLNAGGKRRAGKPFKPLAIQTVLSSRLYIGEYVFGRTASNLGNIVRLPEDRWVVTKVMDPLIPETLFRRAQAHMEATRKGRVTTEKLLTDLARLFAEHGTLSTKIIDQDPSSASAHSYIRRFKTLRAAFRLVGFEDYKPYAKQRPVDHAASELADNLRAIWDKHGAISARLINAEGQHPARYYRWRFGSLTKAYEASGLPSGNRERRRTGAKVTAALGPAVPRPTVPRATDAEMINHLRQLYIQHGYVTAEMLNDIGSPFKASRYRERFDTLAHAYALAGLASTQSSIMRAAYQRVRDRADLA
ncbi:recombinase family protein [Caulobacter sp. BE264]|uniref:recombinase family protein n=1 Tax=Caulobacter sp. BE264 TaxID=2817724 RepID=UPI00286CE3CB|nr:recombinase family protein [Caulobacter sp. BE264]